MLKHDHVKSCEKTTTSPTEMHVETLWDVGVLSGFLNVSSFFFGKVAFYSVEQYFPLRRKKESTFDQILNVILEHYTPVRLY